VLRHAFRPPNRHVKGPIDKTDLDAGSTQDRQVLKETKDGLWVSEGTERDAGYGYGHNVTARVRIERVMASWISMASPRGMTSQPLMNSSGGAQQSDRGSRCRNSYWPKAAIC